MCARRRRRARVSIFGGKQPCQQQEMSMATRDELFPSKYLSVSDLGGKELTLKIAEANVETLKALDGRESTKIHPGQFSVSASPVMSHTESKLVRLSGSRFLNPRK
jgi:hypothetical protein